MPLRCPRPGEPPSSMNPPLQRTLFFQAEPSGRGPKTRSRPRCEDVAGPPPLLSAPFGSFNAEATKPRSRPRCEDEAGPQSFRAGSRSGGKGTGGGGSARVPDNGGPQRRRSPASPLASGASARTVGRIEAHRAGLGRPWRRMPPRACVPGLRCSADAQRLPRPGLGLSSTALIRPNARRPPAVPRVCACQWPSQTQSVRSART